MDRNTYRSLMESIDQIREQHLTEAKVKGGLEIDKGTVRIANTRISLAWFRTQKVAEIARDMFLDWGKKHGLDFAKSGADIPSIMAQKNITPQSFEKDLKAIQAAAYTEYNRLTDTKK
jgi:hypothetical protein